MAHVIRASDGTQRTVFGLYDLLDWVGDCLGDEVRHELEDAITDVDTADYIQQLETDNTDLRAHHMQVMESMYELTKQIPQIIQEREIDRQRLSSLAGKISQTVRRELR